MEYHFFWVLSDDIFSYYIIMPHKLAGLYTNLMCIFLFEMWWANDLVIMLIWLQMKLIVFDRYSTMEKGSWSRWLCCKLCGKWADYAIKWIYCILGTGKVVCILYIVIYCTCAKLDCLGFELFCIFYLCWPIYLISSFGQL